MPQTVQDARFLQTHFWAEFKGAHGWKPYYFYTDKACTAVFAQNAFNEQQKEALFPLTVLVRAFSVGIKTFSLAYIPMAPEVNDSPLQDYFLALGKLSLLLKPFLPKNTLFVRFDPPVDFEQLEECEAFKKNVRAHKKGTYILQKSPVDIQPPDTVLLSLNKSEDDLLSQMKSKWRYNIRLAAKKGVLITKHFACDADFGEAFEHFFKLFEQTSARDGVRFHGKEYYRDLLTRGSKISMEGAPLITLYLAKHENDFLAGIITLFCKREAVYLYGASGNVKRNYMPAYLLQWTAIQDAKKYGCPVYDFYGMPPTANEHHPMHGLYLFKTGFGGTIVHRPGSFDVPLKAGYRIYIFAEKVRAWWHKKLYKALIGR